MGYKQCRYCGLMGEHDCTEMPDLIAIPMAGIQPAMNDAVHQFRHPQWPDKTRWHDCTEEDDPVTMESIGMSVRVLYPAPASPAADETVSVTDLARAAWGALNHDNDFDGHEEHNVSGRKALESALRKVMTRQRGRSSSAADERVRELENIADKAESFIALLDMIHDDPRYRSVWEINQIHAGPYTGPKYDVQMAGLRAALSARKADGKGGGE